MKKIIPLLAILAILAIGCERETTPRVDRYKYVVTTTADSTLVQYIDSTGIEKSHYVYESWEYAWTQIGYRQVRLIASTNCVAQYLAISIERNDTTIALSSGPAPIPELYVVAYW